MAKRATLISQACTKCNTGTLQESLDDPNTFECVNCGKEHSTQPSSTSDFSQVPSNPDFSADDSLTVNLNYYAYKDRVRYEWERGSKKYSSVKLKQNTTFIGNPKDSVLKGIAKIGATFDILCASSLFTVNPELEKQIKDLLPLMYEEVVNKARLNLQGNFNAEPISDDDTSE